MAFATPSDLGMAVEEITEDVRRRQMIDPKGICARINCPVQFKLPKSTSCRLFSPAFLPIDCKRSYANTVFASPLQIAMAVLG